MEYGENPHLKLCAGAKVILCKDVYEVIQINRCVCVF